MVSMTVRAADGRPVTIEDLHLLRDMVRGFESDAEEASIKAGSGREVGWAESEEMMKAGEEIARAERLMAKALDAYASEARRFIRKIEER